MKNTKKEKKITDIVKETRPRFVAPSQVHDDKKRKIKKKIEKGDMENE